MRTSSIGMFGILLAAVTAAAGCGTDGMAATPAAPTAPVTPPRVMLDISEINGPYSFYPSPALIGAKQMVVWHNRDTVTHHVVFDDNSLDTGTLAPDTLSQPMTVATGTWPYHCSIHPSMTGTLTVPSS
jgi:plastocyanin